MEREQLAQMRDDTIRRLAAAAATGARALGTAAGAAATTAAASTFALGQGLMQGAAAAWPRSGEGDEGRDGPTTSPWEEIEETAFPDQSMHSPHLPGNSPHPSQEELPPQPEEEFHEAVASGQRVWDYLGSRMDLYESRLDLVESQLVEISQAPRRPHNFEMSPEPADTQHSWYAEQVANAGGLAGTPAMPTRVQMLLEAEREAEQRPSRKATLDESHRRAPTEELL